MGAAHGRGMAAKGTISQCAGFFSRLAVLTVGAPTALSVAPAQAATATTPTITKFNQNLDTIYPRSATVSATACASPSTQRTSGTRRQQDPQSWDVTVRNADGRTVASHEGNVPTYYSTGWTWNTKNQFTGAPVQTGRYTSHADGHQPGHRRDRHATTVLHATTDTVNKRITKSRNGTDTSARSHAELLPEQPLRQSLHRLLGWPRGRGPLRLHPAANAFNVSWGLVAAVVAAATGE